MSNPKIQGRSIFFVSSRTQLAEHMREILGNIVHHISIKLGEPINLTSHNSPDARVIKQIITGIREADVVIVDISGLSPNVMYELGLAHSTGKPVIQIFDGQAPLPFDIAQFRVLIYDAASSISSFAAELNRAILRALEIEDSDEFRDPVQISEEVLGQIGHNDVFVSYSHADSLYLNRIRIHLKPLEKAGLIKTWEDTQLKGGQKWKKEIQLALERARIAVLLVSADFLASDFIIDNELPPLLQAAEKKGTTIIPLIIKPCSFMRHEALSSFQAMNNPSRPLILLSEGEQEAIYAKLADRIEAVVKPVKN